MSANCFSFWETSSQTRYRGFASGATGGLPSPDHLLHPSAANAHPHRRSTVLHDSSASLWTFGCWSSLIPVASVTFLRAPMFEPLRRPRTVYAPLFSLELDSCHCSSNDLSLSGFNVSNRFAESRKNCSATAKSFNFFHCIRASQILLRHL